MKMILKILTLLIDEKHDFLKNKTNYKKYLYSMIKTFLIIIIATAVCYYLFLKMKIYGINFNYTFFGVLLLITQAIALFISLGEIMNTLYNSKDNELLMCLPVTHNQIFISKLLVLYISDFISNAIYSLPLFLSFGFISRQSLIYYCFIIVLLFVLPLLPLAISSLISIPISKLLNFIKQRFVLLVTTILSASSILLYFYMSLIGKLFKNINITGDQIKTVIQINKWIKSVEKYNPFSSFAKSIIVDNRINYILLYVVVATVTLLIATLLIKPFYFKLIANVQETKAIVITKAKLKDEPVLLSLIRKEFYTVFRTPGYIFQYFIFALLMPLIVLLYDKLLITITVTSIGKVMIGGAHILILSILTLLSTIVSSTTISREGNTYYIMKVSPVDYKLQILAKGTFNFLIIFCSVIVTTIVTLLMTDIASSYIVLSTIIVLFLAIAQIAWNIDLDLKKPTLDWYDSSEISSISKNTINSMINSLIISAIVTYLVFLFAHTKWVWYIVLVFSILFAVGRVKLLNARIISSFKNNEV